LVIQKNKPKQTQFKAKTNPIDSKGKNDAKYVFTKDYDEKCEYRPKKTNPIQSQFKPNFKGRREFYLRWKNIMLAYSVESHIIVVRNILNCNDRLAKPWSKITLDNPESASRTTFRIIPLVLPVLSKERSMHSDSDESLCLSKFEYCIF
jgi:hypothetical protein